MKTWIGNGALAAVSLLIGFAVCETGYRYYRYWAAPQDFMQDLANPPSSLTFYNRSIWEFDEAFGFRYRRDAPVVIGSLSGGHVAGCVQLGPQDYGGMGSKERWADGADLKVLVFGDSFTAIADKGRTWTDYLQEELQRRLARKVDVINMALDGIGVLQMFDIAADKVPELKPDLAVIAFITDDITRARIWRVVAEVEGRVRVFTTTKPDRKPDLRHAVDVTILHPDITQEWCNRSPPPDRSSDAVVRDLEERYRLAAKQAGTRWDLYGLTRSVLLERLVGATRLGPLLNPRANSTNPRHTLLRFSDDERMARNARAIRESGTPLMLFHLATRRELRSKQEYFFGKSVYGGLLPSLEQLAGTRINETLEHVTVNESEINSLGISPVDEHPSAHGMRVYAGAVAEALVRDGKLLQGRRF